jgi:peptide deformylase
VSVRVILRFGDPFLRLPAKPVTTFDEQLRELISDLMETIDVDPDGRAGLAAVQVGVGLRVFGYLAAGARGHLVNPEIVERAGTQPGEEACLSVPGLAYPTPRAEHVTVTGYDGYGEPVTLRASGFLARAMQHEVDHLDGLLYLDRLTGDVRRQALREARASRRPPRATAPGSRRRRT